GHAVDGLAQHAAAVQRWRQHRIVLVRDRDAGSVQRVEAPATIALACRLQAVVDEIAVAGQDVVDAEDEFVGSEDGHRVSLFGDGPGASHPWVIHRLRIGQGITKWFASIRCIDRPNTFGVNPSNMRFEKLDLNLLVALDTLLSELNITRAAERLNMSQSAMS